ncbi:hypothetical protein APY04_0195 [Hyphomicrobium sulfonivorans]|uniref:Uncharacterized protein n=2 Tax=Hyphomicrobium sulfonivorans TaxID=121290 RepID=A0A109BP47_HYPSL|nr:hypothetical protein APY04_0195 [Hyphomicrobium sulfonivorans]
MRACFIVAAVTLAGLALGLTLTFYTGYAQTTAEAVILVTLCAMSFATKFLAPAGVKYVRGHAVAQSLLWVGFAAAVVFDTFGTAGFWEMTYGMRASQITTASHAYNDAEAEKTRRQADVDEYADVRPTTEIKTELDSETVAAGNCNVRRAHTDACKTVAALKLELARAETRDRRREALTEASAKFDNLEKPAVAENPQRAVLSKIGGYIGVEDAGVFVAPILSVLTFIFVEIVAPTLFFVAVHGGSSKPPAPVPRERYYAPAVAPAPRRQRVQRCASAEDLLEFLRDVVDGARSVPGLTVNGRRVQGSQRAIGHACEGVSVTTINRHLAALRDAGAIALIAGRNGTEIEVLS